MAVGKYFSFVIPQTDGIVTVSGPLVKEFGFKLKQAPEGYMQFRQIGFDADGRFVVEVRHEHSLDRTNHRFLLQLQASNSPDPTIDGAIVSCQRGGQSGPNDDIY